MEVVSADEKVEIDHEYGEAQIRDLESMVSEEDEIDGKGEDEWKECYADATQQLFLFPIGGPLSIDERNDTRQYHQHAAAEEMVGEGLVHGHHPIPLALHQNEE